MDILKEFNTFFSSLKEKITIPFGEKGIGNSFDPKDFSEFSQKNAEVQEPLESDKVKVVPATEEQSLEYSRLESYEWKTFAESFSSEQMNAIPDIIEGRSLDKSDKIDLLFNNFLNFDDSKGNEITYVIDNNNNILKKYLDLDADKKSKPLEFITKEDVQFNKQESIVPMLDVYLANKEGHVTFETVSKPLEVGDRINLLTKSGDLYAKGEVKNINNVEIELNTSKGIVISPFDARIEPLFINDSQNKKINIEYGVNETITLVDQKKLGLHENYFGNRMNDFTDLLKGNKTTILPFEKGNEKEEGKLQIIKNFEGKPFVSLDLKNPKLNVDAPYIQYGIDHFKLNQEQKEQLKKTGELGLVNLTSNVTNKESNLWVSVDKELNKVVTQKSEAIKINKIFGTPTTDEQKNKLKSGEGILLDIKGTNYFIIASAASKNIDGLRTFTESKAREFKLIPNQDLEQSNKKTSGIKF